MTTFSVTGHRPNKCGGYTREAQTRLVDFASEIVLRYVDDDVVFVTGMALGWDQAIAEACMRWRIPFIAAIPFEGQESIWPPAAKERYKLLLHRAAGIECISEPGFSPQKMILRNNWMVDNSDCLIALYNGDKFGGTFRCVDYAQKSGKEIINVWKEWEMFK